MDLRPAYLVDFQLVYRFIYLSEDNPEWLAELEYLFEQKDLLFIIGPGTLIEVTNHLTMIQHSVRDTVGIGDKVPSLSSLRTLLRTVSAAIEDVIEQHPSELFAIERLHGFLRRDNVVHYADLPAHNLEPDAEAYRIASAAMKKYRPDPRKMAPNLADALNFAATVTLRRAAGERDFDMFPYLLTATTSLLNERKWSHDPGEKWGVQSPISRPPRSALISHAVMTSFSSLDDGVRHCEDMRLEASVVRRRLKALTAYGDQSTGFSDDEWEEAIDDSRLDEQSEEAISLVAGFFKDPVIGAAQRIVDDIDLVVANFRRQQEEFLSAISTSRRLVSLVLRVARTLDDTRRRAGASVSQMWRLAIRAEQVEAVSFHGIEFFDRESDESLLMAHCASSDGRSLTYSWPTFIDLGFALQILNDAAQHHAMDKGAMYFGTPSGAWEAPVAFPISYDEVLEEVGDDGPIQWIRVDTDSFTAYSDIVRQIGDHATLSLRISAIDVDYIAELYAATSGQFVFPSWARRILEIASNTDSWSHSLAED
ncbi:MAG: hypothetical protein ACREX3_14690 [Gammaproteobacteria bacterium]